MSLGASDLRLFSVAELVRQGAVLADIGTDHAHLPIFLLEKGRIERAVCSDINKGPLSSAENNAKAAGVSERIKFVLTDGAAALFGFGVTDYAICGMGGELIADIIDRAEHLRDGSLRLILQPMTKQAHLRRYLYNNGFEIECESYSTEGERHYVAMLVKYTGHSREITQIEAEIGTNYMNYVNKSSQISYLKGKNKAYKKTIDGKKTSGGSFDDEAAVLSGITAAISRLEASIN